MSTTLNPAAAQGLFKTKRKSDAEQALERAIGDGKLTDSAEPEDSKALLERAAEQNDRRGKA